MENLYTFVPNFTEYGNQPKVMAIAFNTRMEIESTRIGRKKKMECRRDVAGHVRRNGRVGVCEPDAWHRENQTRKGRSWFSAAPRSPADHWLLRQGYQKFPF